MLFLGQLILFGPKNFLFCSLVKRMQQFFGVSSRNHFFFLLPLMFQNVGALLLLGGLRQWSNWLSGRAGLGGRIGLCNVFNFQFFFQENGLCINMRFVKKQWEIVDNYREVVQLVEFLQRLDKLLLSYGFYGTKLFDNKYIN